MFDSNEPIWVFQYRKTRVGVVSVKLQNYNNKKHHCTAFILVSNILAFLFHLQRKETRTFSS